jgi:hypothetical protein
VVTAWVSPDAQTWQFVASQQIDLGQQVRAGLALTSHAASVLGSAEFEGVSLRSSGGFLPAPVAMSDAWKQAWFGTLIVDPFGDPDGDGCPNWREYALGSSPLKGFVADGGGEVRLKVFRP